MNAQPSLVRSLPVNCRVALVWPASDDDVAAIFRHCTGLKRLYVVKQPGDPRPPSSLLGNPCIRFVNIADERAVGEVLPPLFEKDNLAFIEGRVGVGIDERRRQADPEFCRRLEACVLDFTRDMVASAAFRCTHGWHVLENMFLNLGRIRREPTLDSLFDRASGRPVVIVGAGPSLDRNIGVLASFMDRVTIVACDAAWPMLMRAGVMADLVVTLDDGDLVWRFFAPIPAELQATTGLVGILSSNWHVMRNYRGPIFFGRYDKPMDRQLEKALSRPIPLIDGGQCVGHAAFEVARLMGADPIVMAGFDLAYSDNRFYSKSMEVPIFEALEPPPENMVSVEGIDGKPVRTEISFLMYLREFERRIARCGRRVWDATEGGARKAGARIVDLKTALTESLGAAAAAKPRVTEPAAIIGEAGGQPRIERWRESARELTLKIREALRDGLLMEREPAPYPFLNPYEELLDLVSSVMNPCLMAELFWAWDDWITDRQGIVQRPDEVGERYLREILLSMDLLNELLVFDGSAGAAPSGKAITFCRGQTVPPAWSGFVKWLQNGAMETIPFMGDFDHVPLIWKTFRHFGSDIAVLLDGAVFPAAWTWPGRICLDFRTQPPDDTAGFMASEFWIPGYAAIGCDARVEAAWKACMPPDRPLCRLEQREGQFRLMSGETPVELQALLARLRAEVR